MNKTLLFLAFIQLSMICAYAGCRYSELLENGLGLNEETIQFAAIENSNGACNHILATCRWYNRLEDGFIIPGSATSQLIANAARVELASGCKTPTFTLAQENNEEEYTPTPRRATRPSKASSTTRSSTKSASSTRRTENRDDYSESSTEDSDESILSDINAKWQIDFGVGDDFIIANAGIALESYFGKYFMVGAAFDLGVYILPYDSELYDASEFLYRMDFSLLGAVGDDKIKVLFRPILSVQLSAKTSNDTIPFNGNVESLVPGFEIGVRLFKNHEIGIFYYQPFISQSTLINEKSRYAFVYRYSRNFGSFSLQ